MNCRYLSITWKQKILRIGYYYIIEGKRRWQSDIYIDGKKYEHALLDYDKIATFDFIKSEKARKKYNAPNGVAIVETKSGKKE